MDLLFHIEVYGITHEIRVHKPTGAGILYHVLIDNYYRGSIVERPWGLHPYIEPGEVLYSDEFYIIIEMINYLEPRKN